MDRVLSENGYSIILKNTCNSRSKEEKVLKELLDKPIDGLIIEPSKSQILCRHINLYEMLTSTRSRMSSSRAATPRWQTSPAF